MKTVKFLTNITFQDGLCSVQPGFHVRVYQDLLQTSTLNRDTNSGPECNFCDFQTKSDRTFEMLKQHEQREEMLFQRQSWKKNLRCNVHQHLRTTGSTSSTKKLSLGEPE